MQNTENQMVKNSLKMLETTNKGQNPFGQFRAIPKGTKK